MNSKDTLVNFSLSENFMLYVLYFKKQIAGE